MGLEDEFIKLWELTEKEVGHPNLRHGGGKSQEGASERGHEGRLAPKKSAYFPRTRTTRTLGSLLGLVGLTDA